MKYLLIIISVLSIAGCSMKNNYDVADYYDASQCDSIQASIINYIFIAPPYTLMKDRFKPEHRSFYSDPKTLRRFSIDKFYKNEKGVNYFLMLRPGNRVEERRAVGGYFKLGENYTLEGFREIFVTPILAEQDAKAKGEFLFEKMVKGEVDEFLKMKSYVQWPNDASLYDTVTYQWILNKEKLDIK
ncbi:MAG TPA: hypothetical protein VL443_23815 [Cyclobacteriaceae bacterium]|jgi:hypothetical protein|nr:hypothetical protein [Cyclobacteriaceae bacterium]